MIARSYGLKIWNNTIQFMSGIGVGLYRDDEEHLTHNRIDWCVRGYSHGFYNRGQDSPACSCTSSRAGTPSPTTRSRTVATGCSSGGAVHDGHRQRRIERQPFYANDFSHAATNGIEATFSRNTFTGNRVEECWHGVWGGYSSLDVDDNRFARNTEAIAIEHGQDNIIEATRSTATDGRSHLAESHARSQVGIPEASRNAGAALPPRNTSALGQPPRLEGRRQQNVTHHQKLSRGRATVPLPATRLSATIRPRPHPALADEVPPPKLPGAIDPKNPDRARRAAGAVSSSTTGAQTMGSLPKLWPSGRPDARPLRLRVPGPAGDWTVAAVRGAIDDRPKRGTLPGVFSLAPSDEAQSIST